MCNLRKAMAILLVLVFSLSFAVSASAASSPDKATTPATAETPAETTTPAAEPEWDRHIFTPANNTDTYFPVDGTIAGYGITADGATLINVTSPKANGHVTANEAKDGNGNLVSITQIGNGSGGIGQVASAEQSGQNVTALSVFSDKKVTIAPYAFKGSRITTIAFSGDSIAIKANAFKGSSAKTIVIKALNVKTCDSLQLNKKAFNGLKKVTIQVSSKMLAGEYKMLKAKMKKKYGSKFGKSILLKQI